MADLKYYDIILKPVITEKSMGMMDQKKYSVQYPRMLGIVQQKEYSWIQIQAMLLLNWVNIATF